MGLLLKAMIVVNLSTEGDVANGTRGTITAIILDPREQRSEPDEEGAIRLMYPPAMILFEPDGGFTNTISICGRKGPACHKHTKRADTPDSLRH